MSTAVVKPQVMAVDFQRSGLIERAQPAERDHVLPAVPDLVQARSDFEAAAIWLEATTDNPKTRRAMRKEAERFLLWARHARDKGLSQIGVMDVRAYLAFLADPQPASVWVSPTKHPRQHPDWRPFAGPLGVSSQRYALVQLGSLYSWMVKAGWLKGNPVALVKKPQAAVDPMIQRLLPVEGIALAFEAIAATKSPLKRARDHFMLSLFYMTGLRTFEATASNMGTLRRSASGHLWLMVDGKRNKRREVPISEALFKELQYYRQAMGLPAEILPGESTPLLMAANSKGKRASHSTVLKAMIDIMTRAAELARERRQYELADRLGEATTHWLRHSCFSHLAQATGDLVMVRSLAGHARLDTTSRYLHAEANQMHNQVSEPLKTPAGC
ncbi:tyrosine-type recombinase/integrase (plasmid) [Pseudomonas sp. HR96]|uniref:tyrosine-type recombinase/integrase n=1 Tax=Pseudomonas sp. HR96 TaxID=1027966 RepID=UPI002A765276|nr:tyrosine-type recombinase/integrase [Pseudomonas sp. HR96]WPP02506.1 tyrosine-type recombinase/integrase [Pseudomonas sp. HR96]